MTKSQTRATACSVLVFVYTFEIIVILEHLCVWQCVCERVCFSVCVCVCMCVCVSVLEWRCNVPHIPLRSVPSFCLVAWVWRSSPACPSVPPSAAPAPATAAATRWLSRDCSSSSSSSTDTQEREGGRERWRDWEEGEGKSEREREMKGWGEVIQNIWEGEREGVEMKWLRRGRRNRRKRNEVIEKGGGTCERWDA